MGFSLYDWGIILLAIIALRLVSLSTRKHIKGVSDFLSANRSAGRYLLVISQGMGVTGAISWMASFEMIYQTGFVPIWWSMTLATPVGVIIILSGWIYYRFRETRAMTMAQFFEMRYSRRFRIFAGILCWASGLISFGIFPAVAAHFFIYFCGIPEYYNFGILPFSIPMFPLIMLMDIGFALTFVTMGGQVSVMVTECAQGIFCGFVFIVISTMVLLMVQWQDISKALSTAPSNASMVNPFHTSRVKDFNFAYFMIAAIGEFYGFMSWQGAQGFNSAARTPHEQRMGSIISIWREISPAGFLLPIAAFAVMQLPSFSHQADIVNETLKGISSETVQNQMRVPVILANLLPVGIKGLFVTAILFFSFTSMDSNMHSWGSIFIQDVYMPIKKKVLTPEQHIKYLRWSIIGVCVFVFLFSWFYPIDTKIYLFMAITRTIWLGGSGAAIIGGLYWKRGTTPAAYTALILGATLGIGGLIVPNLYKDHYGHDFPVNGQWLWAIAFCSAILVYTIVSLATSRGKEYYNLDRLLHRGEYAVKSDHISVGQVTKNRFLEYVGIRKEFTKSDKVFAIALLVWRATMWSFALSVSFISLFHDLGDIWWTKFWHFFVFLYFFIGIPGQFWFAIGGVLDIRSLYKSLATAVRDHTDDGRVFHEPDRITEQVMATTPQTQLEEPLPEEN